MVGLAIARELGLAGRQVLVLDSGPAIGTQTSSRNSEVIHSGGMHYGQNYNRGIVKQSHVLPSGISKDSWWGQVSR